MKKIFSVLLLLVAAARVLAVPAYPERIVFTQPNRETTVTIFLKGDERVHWAETLDGYSLLHSDDGSLVYAYSDDKGNMMPSRFLASEIEARSNEVSLFLKNTPKHLHFSQQQVDEMLSIWKQVENAKSGPKTMTNVIGNKKFLVILFAFNDKAFSHSKSEFKSLFNQVNYTTGGRTGSVRDYYYDVSGGLFTLSVDVVGPYTGAYHTAYYGDSDQGYQYFAHEAVDSAAQDVDFSDYDNDNDGYIDGLHIIFAGYGEEAGAGSDCIWSHKWNIFNAPTYNNTVVDVYSCSPECNGSYGDRITNIGVICHELGHVFGAPDYYDTDYAGSGGEYPGLGQWDIMSSGSWNRGGISPAHHNPYTKTYIYHWTTCDTIDSTPRTYTVNPAETSNSDFYRVNTSTEGDFFMLENRQKLKWDKAIPGEGLLVYHIHPDSYGAYVSNSSHPQQIYILAQTNDTFPNATPGSYGYLNDASTTYPRQGGRNDSLTNYSIPWFRPWSRQQNSVTIHNIATNGDTRQVFFTVGNGSPDLMNVFAEGIDQQSIALRWTRYGTYKTMIVANAEGPVTGTPSGSHNVGDTVDGGIVVYKGSSNNFLVDSLLTNHLYHFRLYACKNDTTYSNGIDVSARTLNCTNSEWTSEDFETTSIGELPDCWTGDWSVDSLMGGQVLTSCSNCTAESAEWKTVYTQPITFGSVQNAVLHFRLHFNEFCNENTVVKTEFRNNATAEWATIDSISWTFGAATWREVYLLLPNAGERSRIRFSIYSDGSSAASIDNIEITKGNLIYATSDANGSIQPSGYSILGAGDTIAYIMTPLPGYEFKSLLMNGSALPAGAIIELDNGSFQYNVTGLSGQHTYKATFERKSAILAYTEQTLKAYPNPANDRITIETLPGNTVTLFDITGRQIAQQKPANNIVVFNLKDLPQGIYVLRDDKTTIKIVKK